MRAATWLAGAALFLAPLPGCKDKAKELSSVRYNLDVLYDHWDKAESTLQSAQPDYGLLRNVHVDLGDARTALERGYAKDNKAELLAKLDAVIAAFQTEVAPKVSMRSQQVRPLPGVAPEDIRAGFAKVAKEFNEFKPMVK